MQQVKVFSSLSPSLCECYRSQKLERARAQHIQPEFVFCLLYIFAPLSRGLSLSLMPANKTEGEMWNSSKHNAKFTFGAFLIGSFVLSSSLSFVVAAARDCGDNNDNDNDCDCEQLPPHIYCPRQRCRRLRRCCCPHFSLARHVVDIQFLVVARGRQNSQGISRSRQLTQCRKA